MYQKKIKLSKGQVFNSILRTWKFIQRIYSYNHFACIKATYELYKRYKGGQISETELKHEATQQTIDILKVAIQILENSQKSRKITMRQATEPITKNPFDIQPESVLFKMYPERFNEIKKQLYKLS